MRRGTAIASLLRVHLLIVLLLIICFYFGYELLIACFYCNGRERTERSYVGAGLDPVSPDRDGGLDLTPDHDLQVAQPICSASWIVATRPSRQDWSPGLS